MGEGTYRFGLLHGGGTVLVSAVRSYNSARGIVSLFPQKLQKQDSFAMVLNFS